MHLLVISFPGNSRNVNHHKQGSDETEFEFPPPPSDHDIAQIMSEKGEHSACEAIVSWMAANIFPQCIALFLNSMIADKILTEWFS